MQTAGDEGKKARGRIDREGQQAVIKMESLVVKLQTLIDLHNAAAEAATDYSDAIKAAAESSGLLAATVSKFVKARAGDKYVESKDKALQLALVFEEVGEK